MTAFCNDPALIEHQDAVGFLDRRKSVGNDQGGPVSRHGVDRALNKLFAFGIQRRVASSRSKIGASRRIARAMAMRCFCPPDSITPRSPT